MSRAEWELIEMARARALADRYEREALESAAAHGCVGVGAQQAWALGWLAMRCADRQVRLENAPPVGGWVGDKGTIIYGPTLDLEAQAADESFRWHKDAARAHDAAGPATPPPPRPQGVAGHPTTEALKRRLLERCADPDGFDREALRDLRPREARDE